MTDKTMREIAKGIAEVFGMPLPTDGDIYYLLKKRTYAILAIPKIKEGQELLEKAKSEKPELDEFLSQELDSTNMEYQRRIAHLLWYADGMGAYGNSHGELAVIRPETGEIVMRERDIPLASGESR